MKKEIKALVLDFDQLEINKITEELLNFDYTLNYKMISSFSELKDEINNTYWDLFITKLFNQENLSEIFNHITNDARTLVITENNNPENIKPILKKGGVDIVTRNCYFEISVAIIRNYERAIVSRQTGSGPVTLLQKTEQKVEKLKNELIAKSNELENVVYITSHDIRSPVVNILGFSDELFKVLDKLANKISDKANNIENKEEIDFLLKRDIPQILNFIKRSGEKIEKQLFALLKLSRLGRSELTLKNLDVNHIIQNVITGFNKITEQENIKINLSDNIPNCYSDETMLLLIITQLLDNAIKFRSTFSDSEISISADQTGNSIIYCITDNGIGIPATDLTKIFDVFYTVSPENSDGIGLALVKKALELIGGEIEVKSNTENPGEGINGKTQVRIKLQKQIA